jgi:hypothetical protein
LVENLKEKGNFKDLGCRQEDNIKIVLRECEHRDQFQVLVNMKIDLWAP